MSNESKAEEIIPPALVDNWAKPHEMMYADQLMAMAIGPFVSRFTLGTEQHNTMTRDAVVTVVMPTNTLRQLAVHLLSQLDRPETRSQMNTDYQSFVSEPTVTKPPTPQPAVPVEKN